VIKTSPFLRSFKGQPATNIRKWINQKGWSRGLKIEELSQRFCECGHTNPRHEKIKIKDLEGSFQHLGACEIFECECEYFKEKM